MNILLYFTGTGNTLHCGKIIKENLPDTYLFRLDINSNIQELQEKINQAERVGILAPVYAGTLPYLAEDILKKLKFTKDQYVFSVVTCGGIDLSIHYDIEKILNKTSKRKLDNNFTVLYPSNFQTNSAPKDEKTILNTIDKTAKDLMKIAKQIENKKQVKTKPKRFMSILSKTALNFAIRKNRSKNFYADEKCISCGICEKVCPTKNIALIDKKPSWGTNCESCMGCIGICPVEAIQYKEKTKTWGRFINPYIDKSELYVKDK